MATNGNLATSSTASAKKTEIISILKHRHNSAENVNEAKPVAAASAIGSSSLNSNTFSDESGPYDENDSDSDWDGFPVSSKWSIDDNATFHHSNAIFFSVFAG